MAKKRIIIHVSLVLLAILALIILFLIGVFAGFVVLGKGSSADAFNTTNWQQVLNILK
ncbi:DNA-directed RNA polymerase subunit beta [Vagococcus vulneris]|uniref:DNA-directed RNA polymerase subunit beta n=1 Tax=Vagococcus vulneris TaxID=1977869 RepID=A0A430A1A6_9ENTE|nr:DNA-directed RNA polymerase subunit beta [Vagococcus vulneris]RSU00195.1 hypothetical protein CBF37_02550 [Vagococcus vulneris]